MSYHDYTYLLEQPIYDKLTNARCEVVDVYDRPGTGTQITVLMPDGGKSVYSPEILWKYFDRKAVKHHANS